jgi:hypothetical protein
MVLSVSICVHPWPKPILDLFNELATQDTRLARLEPSFRKETVFGDRVHQDLCQGIAPSAGGFSRPAAFSTSFRSSIDIDAVPM